jgi:AcrR family transcriptional regulator
MKEDISNKAAQLFFSYGLKSISMDDLAKKTGLSKKTLYQHFLDKNELVNDVADYLIDSHQQTFTHCAKQSKNAVEELFMQSDLTLTSLPNVNLPFFYDLQKYYPAVWDKIVVYKKEFLIPCFETNLQRGINEGFFRTELDIPFTAEIRLQQINAWFNQDEFSSHAQRQLQLQQDLTLFYLHGISTTKGKQVITKYLKSKHENDRTK